MIDIKEYMMDVTFADVVGMVGVLIIVIAYLLLQVEKISLQSLEYSLSNTIGSIMILLSLLEHWNLASVVIEVFWIGISLYGVVKYFLRKP